MKSKILNIYILSSISENPSKLVYCPIYNISSDNTDKNNIFNSTTFIYANTELIKTIDNVIDIFKKQINQNDMYVARNADISFYINIAMKFLNTIKDLSALTWLIHHSDFIEYNNDKVFKIPDDFVMTCEPDN